MNLGASDRKDRLPVVLIYRNHLLPPSETFVRAQGLALKKFKPVYVGSRRVDGGLELPANDTLVVNRGGLGGLASEVAFRIFGVAPRVVSEARRLCPVLMHAHFGPDAAVALPLARLLRVPLVATFHGYDATVTDDYASRSSRSHRHYIHQRGRLVREGRLFIAVSAFIRERLLKQGFPSERTRVHHIGVDRDFFRSDADPTKSSMVLFVGRLVEQKGCAYLIRALARVRASVPGAHLTIVGEGPLRSDLESLAGEVGVPCQFVGVQTPEQVREWMRKARVLGMPSVVMPSGAEEAMGLVSLEAQSMGLPVVASNTGGLKEAVSDGISGLLVPQRDDEAMAHGIARILSEPVFWQRLRNGGQERVARLFDLRVQTAVLERLYEECIDRRTQSTMSFVR